MKNTILLWICLNALFVGFLWLGLEEGSVGARNAALFYAWSTAVLSLISSMVMKQIIADPKNIVWTIPAWVDALFDACVILFLAWHGYFVTAGAYTLQLCTTQNSRTLMARAYAEKNK